MITLLERASGLIAQPAVSKTILLADTDPHNLSLLKTLLTSMKFNVLIANDGFQVIELFKRNKVDIVLTNIYMPALNGMEASKAIRAVAGSKPTIIAISAGNFDLDVLKRAAGINHFFHKPLNIKELKKLLISLL